MALPLRPSEPSRAAATGDGAVQPTAPARRPRRRRPDPWRIAEAVGSVLLALVLLVWVLPLVAGTQWRDIGDVLAQLSPAELALLLAVWQLGLWVHTVALAAAMPGLSHRRAYFLNLTGSAISNILPIGGAAGTALNYTTCRAWGFSTPAFLRWALVTNIWDTLTKLCVPGLALVWVGLENAYSPKRLVSAAIGALVVLGVLVVATWLVLRRDLAARVVGRVLDWVAVRVRRSVPPGHERPSAGRAGERPEGDGPEGEGPEGEGQGGVGDEDGGYVEQVVQFRRDTAALIGSAWRRLTVGKVAYAASQALLLWLCLQVLGAGVSPSVAVTAFAAERVLSLAVITPGAAGVVEVGVTGILVALGVAPALAAAGVLLYRAIVIGLEIPAGGGLMGWWLIRRGGARRRSAPQGQP